MSAISTRARPVTGPLPFRVTDIDAVNRVFSDAFTERYRRDGMAGVRVPQLNPAIWRYAVEGAREGAMVWRDLANDVVAFNVAHLSGREGWMGPLAVRPEWQGTGLGKTIVQAGTSWLLSQGARVVGLETMPRTVDNIGFYSSLGFEPGPLTITVTLDAAGDHTGLRTLGDRQPREREVLARGCRDLLQSLSPVSDYARELALTLQLGLGDACVVEDRGEVSAFAIYHIVPLVEGRPREELRVLKLVARDVDALDQLLDQVEQAASRVGTPRAAIRAQSGHRRAWQLLMHRGARVRWTDLRMTLRGHEETRDDTAVVFSNWEI